MLIRHSQTHHVGLAARVANFVVTLEEDGRIRSAGPIEEVILADEELEEAVKEDTTEVKSRVLPTESKPEEKKPAAKLIQAEEKSEGRISRRALFSFFRLVLALRSLK